jgi:hypothetical protein
MYQTKHLEAFFKKVHEEASAAAQAVYDKYQEEALRRVKAQLHKDDFLWMSMGSGGIDRYKGTLQEIEVGEEFFNVVLEHVNTTEHLEAGLFLPDEIKK